MTKISLTIITILISTITYACSCDLPKPVLEFYSANYVFEGKVISKKYALDSLSYTITFDILKHYKQGDNPKTLDFTIRSESKYHKTWTSCDWSANLNETWLVYAKKRDQKLIFQYFCSNSKPIDNRLISENEQRVLNNGNLFELENYIYYGEKAFNDAQPLINVDSILKLGKKKTYDKPIEFLRLVIDEKGNLILAAPRNRFKSEFDSDFQLMTEFQVLNNEPLTEFQKDAIELVSKIQKWEIKRHKETGVPITYMRGFFIEYDLKTRIWKCSL